MSLVYRGRLEKDLGREELLLRMKEIIKLKKDEPSKG